MKTVALIAGLMMAVVTAGIAFGDSDYKEMRTLMESGKIIPLREILTIASKNPDDRILEAELEKEDGKYIYEVEILGKDGIVWEYEIDATTGEILEREQEN